MFKFLGAIIIIGISTFSGFFFAQKFNERCHLLKLWLRILDIFQTEIFFEARMLPEVFQRTARIVKNPELTQGLTKLASSLEFGSTQDFQEAWGDFLVETGFGVLDKSDYLALQELGQYLGNTDRNDQLAKLKSCRANLELNLQTAENDRKKKVGIYRYLGFASGTMVVLWLL